MAWRGYSVEERAGDIIVTVLADEGPFPVLVLDDALRLVVEPMDALEVFLSAIATEYVDALRRRASVKGQASVPPAGRA